MSATAEDIILGKAPATEAERLALIQESLENADPAKINELFNSFRGGVTIDEISSGKVQYLNGANIDEIAKVSGGSGD